MNNDKYQYDVAISFLEQDETLATELNDLLQDRLSTFLYSEKQKELAGTDGEKTFNAVFGEQARMVVVLYRDGWGETPWTRIEETSIRNRAFEEGYDFLTLVPLEEKPAVPKWLPKNQIWVGLKRWGATGAASVIEARVQELGGTPHEESVEDRAIRLERSLLFQKQRKIFLNSIEGVNQSNDELEILARELEKLLETIKKAAATINYTLKQSNRNIVILGPHAGLSINWKNGYSNTLEYAELEVALWVGHPPYPGVMHYEQPKQKKSIKFKFDLLRPEFPGWKTKYPKQRELDTKELAKYIMKFYMDDADPKK